MCFLLTPKINDKYEYTHSTLNRIYLKQKIYMIILVLFQFSKYNSKKMRNLQIYDIFKKNIIINEDCTPEKLKTSNFI